MTRKFFSLCLQLYRRVQAFLAEYSETNIPDGPPRTEEEFLQIEEEQRKALASPKKRAQRCLRISLLIATLFAVILSLLKILIELIWSTPMFPLGFVLIVTGFFFFCMTVAFSLSWFFGLWFIWLASTTIHFIVGRKVSRKEWNDATYSSLWVLPYAVSAALATGLIYEILPRIGGRHDDVLFGTIGNVIGACVYGTILWNWYKLLKKKRKTGTPL